MAEATVQFATAAPFVGGPAAFVDVANMIDGLPGTLGTIERPDDLGTNLLRLMDPVVPDGFGSLTELHLRARWAFNTAPGKDQAQLALLYSREGDEGAWTLRFSQDVGFASVIETVVPIPVTSLPDLQVLIGNFYQPPSGGSPPDPPPDEEEQ